MTTERVEEPFEAVQVGTRILVREGDGQFEAVVIGRDKNCFLLTDQPGQVESCPVGPNDHVCTLHESAPITRTALAGRAARRAFRHKVPVLTVAFLALFGEAWLTRRGPHHSFWLVQQLGNSAVFALFVLAVWVGAAAVEGWMFPPFIRPAGKAPPGKGYRAKFGGGDDDKREA